MIVEFAAIVEVYSSFSFVAIKKKIKNQKRTKVEVRISRENKTKEAREKKNIPGSYLFLPVLFDCYVVQRGQ